MKTEWINSDMPTKLLEDFKKNSERRIKEVKKDRMQINVMAIVIYIFCVLTTKEVKMFNVLSSSLLVAAHYNFLISSNRWIVGYESDIMHVNGILALKEELKKKEDEIND
ncbi:MAG: hypothetical protein ACRDA3_13160 [Peptostreptococcaceae bacterium]